MTGFQFSISCCRFPILLLTALLGLTACGGGRGEATSSLTTEPAPVSGTLAYVETECRDTGNVFVEHQRLRIRQGEREPVTVFETPEVSVPGKGFLCPEVIGGHFGDGSVAREAFQQVTVSPDGASVAFEVTDEFSVDPHLPLNLPPEKKGIFWVRADGTGVPRKLGPPSRERSFYITGGSFINGPTFDLGFSPDGGTLAFVDKGPDADGHEADQVFTIDVATGTRTQVTHLPPSIPAAGYPPDAPTLRGPVFVDDQRIKFKSTANPNDVNPKGEYLIMTIKTDGSDLQVPLPITVPLAGSQVDLQFVITGGRPLAINVEYAGHPINDPPLGGVQEIWEVFVVDEEGNALQLTNFRRIDTSAGAVDPDGEHVYFYASADPLGTNPSENCQIFSIDRTGADLRQLTNFREVDHSLTGCDFETNGLTGSRPIGCALYFTYQDPRSRTLLFYSECNPLNNMNPNGSQIFAMRPDGSGLRQLTDSQGLVKAPGGYSGAIPGPWAYGPYVPSF